MRKYCEKYVHSLLLCSGLLLDFSSSRSRHKIACEQSTRLCSARPRFSHRSVHNIKRSSNGVCRLFFRIFHRTYNYDNYLFNILIVI